MAITTGNINAAEPAQALYNAIYAALGTNANWSLVDDNIVYTRSTARTASVWKCSGAGNSIGTDYYIVLTRLTAAGSTLVTLSYCESWNATTHQGTNYVTTVNTSSNAQGATSATNPAALTSTFWAESNLTVVASTSADYFINITNSRLAVGINQLTGGNLARYATVITPYTPVSGRSTDAIPVVLWWGQSNGGVAYVARVNPSQSGVGWGVMTYAPLPTRGILSDTATIASVEAGGVEALPAYLRSAGTQATWDSNINEGVGNAPLWSARGVLLNAVIVGEQNGSGFPKNGDTLTVGTDTYVRFGGGNGTTPQPALWLKDVAF
jgi:hypothetical protein